MTKKQWFIVGLMMVLVVIVGGFVIAAQQEKPKAGGMMECCPGCPMQQGQNMGMGMGPMMGEGPILGGMMDIADRMMMWERISNALNLSPEQKKNIETIFLENKKKTIQLKAELEVQQIDLITELRDSKTNDAKVKEISKKIGKLTSDMIEIQIDGILKVKKVLNPEQQEKAIQLIENMKRQQMPMGMRQGSPMMMGPGMMGRGMMEGQMMGPGMMGPMQHQGNKSPEKQEKEESE